ncbi:helix-turn-helix domain-containing protein [Gordonia amicalis]|uniref:helix-turn-helix domain-containing protein n=1 Tax=Gordonia amicalis TaxID=89053 RepID=UPI0039EC14FB
MLWGTRFLRRRRRSKRQAVRWLARLPHSQQRHLRGDPVSSRPKEWSGTTCRIAYPGGSAVIAYDDRLHRGGRTARDIAEQTGLSPRQVQSWTSEPRTTYLARAHERREKIRALRATGLSMRAIATQLGCSVGTVHKALAYAPAATSTE